MQVLQMVTDSTATVSKPGSHKNDVNERGMAVKQPRQYDYAYNDVAKNVGVSERTCSSTTSCATPAAARLASVGP